MPKNPTNPAIGILNYFRKADLAQAEFMLDLCRDAVRSRRDVGAKIKKAQTKGAAATAADTASASTGSVSTGTTKAGTARRKPGPKPKRLRPQTQASEQPAEGQLELPPQDSRDETPEQLVGANQ